MHEYPEGTSREDRRAFMQIQALGETLKGVVIAGVVFFGPVVFIYVLSLVGDLLPPESKEADDPTPDSFVSASEDG